MFRKKMSRTWSCTTMDKREKVKLVSRHSSTSCNSKSYNRHRYCSRDVSADTQMDNDVTPVYLAAQEGHLQVLRFLVEEAGGSLVARARDGMTPLHAASQMGCLDCLQWMILERGVDPNLRDGDGATPLHFAASRGHLPTVRWLLASGAVITQDRFGKSPINDAAENHQVECLNALVQHGAAMEGREGRDGRDGRENREITTHKSLGGYKGVHSCTCREGDNMCSQADCINSNRRRSHSVSRASEPFYLHPPVGANGGHATGPAHAPSDGLYVNPMRNTTHATASSGEESSAASTSSSTGGESFYLHNPQELIYNRVKDLFEGKASPVPLRSITDEREKIRKHNEGMTVKAEVHSSSSGAGSDGNLSSSDGSDVRDHRDIRDLREHDYEDICPPGRAEDARSIYIRSAKRAAENEAALRESRKEKNADDNSKNNKRIVNDASAESGVSSASDGGSSCEEGGGGRGGVGGPPPPPPPPALPIHLAQHPAFHIAEERNNNEGIQRPASRASTPGDRLVNKQLVLPFIPPSFPHLGDSDRLIKPSEYLRSIGDRRSSAASSKHSSDVEDNYMVVSQSDRGRSEGPPIDTAPPPPPPPPPQPADTKLQPLSTISIRDLNSVRLRRTDKMLASKTLSAPVRSVSMQCLATEPFQAQKTDLIAELKMSKDITGIKKMKVERAKMENMVDKEVYSEFTKQFTANNFVEKIPERDPTGNVIPAWKRQMLAKKAAERARRELEQRLAREAEHRRLQAIPAWKRQLLAKKEESDTKIKSTIYTPRVVDEPRNGFHQHEVDACWRNRSPFPPFSPHQRAVSIDNIDLAVDKEDRFQNGDKENRETKMNGDTETNGNGNGESHSEGKTHESDEEIQIIPWRAQLRKTNSKLNLLD